MKDKIVFWGVNEKDQNVLVTLRLRAADNKVDIWMFEKSTVSQEFVDKMFENWDKIDVDTLPEPHEYLEHDMSSPSILPDTILANNTEMINRAEKEWYVKILATKLSMKLQEEVVQLVEQVSSMVKYDKDTWALAKDYWDKINQHFQSRDLTREQTASLRDMINKAFDKLKKLRKHSNEEFEQKAKQNADAIINKLNTIIGQVADSRNLNGLFDTLKQMQSDLRNQRLTQELNHSVREKMNEAFQLVKEARRNHRNNRLTNRIKGLKNAISRMEKSTKRDEDDLAFQNRRVQASEGKLEKQLREAKIVMIQERLDSKNTKLKDMYKTLKELDDRVREEEDREIARQKADKERAEQRAKREAARKAKQAARKAAEEAKKLKEAEERKAAKALEAKAKIAAVIAESKAEDLKEVTEEKMEKMATAIEEAKEMATEKVEEGKDAIEGKIEETAAAIEEAKETATEKVEEGKDAVEGKIEETAAAIEEAKETATEKVEEGKDAIEGKIEETAAVIEEAKEMATEKVEEVKDAVEEKVEETAVAIEEAKETATEKVEEVTDAVEEKVEEVSEAIKSLLPEDTTTIEEAEAESLDVDNILSTDSDTSS